MQEKLEGQKMQGKTSVHSHKKREPFFLQFYEGEKLAFSFMAIIHKHIVLDIKFKICYSINATISQGQKSRT